MSIKTVPKTHTKRHAQLLSEAVVVVRFESGQYHLSNPDEMAMAIKTYKNSILETRENERGIYQFNLMLSPLYSFKAFLCEDTAREKLPKRITDVIASTIYRDKFCVSSVLVRETTDKRFKLDTKYKLAEFERHCLNSCFAGGATVGVMVTFTDGKKISVDLNLSMTKEHHSAGLAQALDMMVKMCDHPEALENYRRINELKTYHFLKSFNNNYEIKQG